MCPDSLPNEPPVHGIVIANHPERERLLADFRNLALRFSAKFLGEALGRKETDSDLAQSVVAELLAGADHIEYRDEIQFRALAKQMILRKVSEKIRYYKAKKRTLTREVRLDRDSGDSVSSTEPAAAGPGPVSTLIGAESLAVGAHGLESLSHRERQVVTMKISGKSHRQIAEALGISVENSERILSDARKKLRALTSRKPS